MTRRLLALAGAVLLIATGALAGCAHETVDVAAWEHPDFSQRGPITYVQGKDNSGKLREFIAKWNREHPREKARMIELSTEADQQRNAMVQGFQTKSDTYCVLSVDNIWVPEFAANRWIVPLPEKQLQDPDILRPVWDTGVYRGRFYAMPHASDAALLYYRSDLLAQAGINEPPRTWADMHADCDKVRKLPGQQNIGCYASQEAKYEGLTVNTMSAINTAGGDALDSHGKVVIDSPAAHAGLDRLVAGVKEGFIPREALTYKEEEGRAAFEKGRLLFYANWPYMYMLTKKALPGKFGVAPLPGMGAHVPGVSSLGGHNAAISTYCKNKGTALDFVKEYSSKESVQWALDTMTLAPTYGSIFDDPKNQRKYPYLPALKRSIMNAKPRPRIVNYADISATIQDRVFAALKGEMTTDQALHKLQREIDRKALR